MLDQINQWDKDVILFINSFHNDFVDSFMIFMSDRFVWIPLYLSIIFVLIFVFKKDFWKHLLTILVVFFLTEKTSAALAKPFFERLRPCHEPSIESLLHLPDGCGGQFGFFSTHAANTFGLAIVLIFALPKQWKWFGISILVWSIIVSFSRVYLAAHYTTDVLVGWFDGFLIASFTLYFAKKITFLQLNQ